MAVSSLNYDANAALFGTVNTSDGQLTAGWNHGLPHAQPYPGYVYDVAVAPQGQVIVAGKPHFYAILDSATGAVLQDVSTPADSQSIDIDGDSILIGCHCSNDESWLRQLDATTMNVVWKSDDLKGRSGVFAATTRSDGCVYGGGELTNGTTSGGGTTAVFNLALFCPPGSLATSAPLATLPVSTDHAAPTTPGTPVITEVVASSVRIAWAPATDNRGDVTYRVIRNGVVVGSTGGTSFYDPDLATNTSYDWQVIAVDLAGNASDASARSTRLALGSRTNIAQGKPAQQSTTREFYTADRAVDGNNSGSFAVGSLAVTQAGDRNVAGSWWEIDLGQVTGVQEVDLSSHRRWWRHRPSQLADEGLLQRHPITEPTFFQAAFGGYVHLKGRKHRRTAQRESRSSRSTTRSDTCGFTLASRPSLRSPKSRSRGSQLDQPGGTSATTPPP
ncbi:MAG: fibronectin type III domain-containing protein [Acidimicrobiales bacterium]